MSDVVNPFVHRVKTRNGMSNAILAWFKDRKWGPAIFSSTWGWKGVWRYDGETREFAFKDVRRAVLFKMSGSW